MVGVQLSKAVVLVLENTVGKVSDQNVPTLEERRAKKRDPRSMMTGEIPVNPAQTETVPDSWGGSKCQKGRSF